MPIYVYQAENPEEGCDKCSSGFETRQSMSEDALSQCPQCEKGIQRVIQPVGISTRTPTKKLLSDDNLKKNGFSKLVNEGDGKFRKTV